MGEVGRGDGDREGEREGESRLAGEAAEEIGEGNDMEGGDTGWGCEEDDAEEMAELAQLETEALSRFAETTWALKNAAEADRQAAEEAVRRRAAAKKRLEEAQRAYREEEVRAVGIEEKAKNSTMALEDGRELMEEACSLVRKKAQECREAWVAHTEVTARLAASFMPTPRVGGRKGGGLKDSNRQRQGDLEAAARTHEAYMRLWEEMEALCKPSLQAAVHRLASASLAPHDTGVVKQ